MIKIGILGDIGSGKSFVANSFGYPVFNADFEVSQLYRKNKKIFKKLKKILPKYFHTFPIDKSEVSKAILANKSNLNKIIKILFCFRRYFKIIGKINNLLFCWFFSYRYIFFK